MNMLYVEDDAHDADLTRRQLQKTAPHIDLEIVPTLSEARIRLDQSSDAATSTKSFDIVLTDMRLPDGNGLDLLAEIRARGLPLAVVMITGSGDEEAVITALRAGADDYVVKNMGYLENLPITLQSALEHFRTGVLRQSQPLHVLCAEHDTDDVDLISHHFARRAPQIRLDVVHTATEALARLPMHGPRCDYDVLLLDYRLPGMNALEAMRELLQVRGLDLPTVIITGRGDEQIALQALKLGAADYLVKGPDYLYRLQAALENAFFRAQLAREQAALRESEIRYRTIVETEPECVTLIGREGQVIEINPAGLAMIEADTPDQALNECIATIVAPAHRAAFERLTEQVFAGQSGQLEFEIIGFKGTRRWLETHAVPLHNPQGEVQTMLGVTRDITERKQSELALYESEQRLELAVQGANLGLWDWDIPSGKVVFNGRWAEMLGYALEEIENTVSFWNALIHPDDLPCVEKALRSHMEGKTQFYETEHRCQHKNGDWVWVLNRGKVVGRDAAGKPIRAAGTVLDITVRKQHEDHIQHLAYHDSLTGLPNRTLMLDRLGQGLAHAQRQHRQLAVLFIDLDRFKVINDTLGHHVGDALLKEAAGRLREAVREEDTVARLGGDEFLIVLPRGYDAVRVARQALTLMAIPFKVFGHDLYVTASVGISVYPRDGEDSETLIKRADVALYRAKQQGRNIYRYFSADMDAQSRARLDMEQGLRRALERNELILHYQPLVDLQSMAITGAEALIRWQHPLHGLVSPTEFIPLAEETGLITPIGEWVLRTACTQARAWQKAGFTGLQLAVNVSARQLQQDNLHTHVGNILAETGLDPRWLGIEITESTVMSDPGHAIRQLHALSDMGIQIALDDFGTGYSSLGYLKRLPLDHLKIDRSFVRDIPQDGDDAAIVQAIIAMAHQLNLRVVAEGVETEAQQSFLKAQGCDEMQGYIFQRPIPGEQFAALLQQGVA